MNVDKTVIADLEAALDRAEAVVLAMEEVPDWVVGVVGRSRALLRAMRMATPPAQDKRVVSKMSGYTGDPCPDCGQFTLVRRGTCLGCDRCGFSQGCG